MGAYHHGFYSRTSSYQSRHDSVWVVVNRLPKFAYALPFKITYSMDKFGSIYVIEIVHFYGVPMSTILD